MWHCQKPYIWVWVASVASSIACTFHFGLPSLHTDLFPSFLRILPLAFFSLHAPSPPYHSVYSWKASKPTNVSPSRFIGCHICKAEQALVGAGAGQTLRCAIQNARRESDSSLWEWQQAGRTQASRHKPAENLLRTVHSYSEKPPLVLAFSLLTLKWLYFLIKMSAIP